MISSQEHERRSRRGGGRKLRLLVAEKFDMIGT